MIVIGSIAFVGLVVAMVVYGIRSNGTLSRRVRCWLLNFLIVDYFLSVCLPDDNIVVIDKQGRKIRQKKNTGNTISGGTVAGGAALPVNQTNPDAQGLWRWSVLVLCVRVRV